MGGAGEHDGAAAEQKGGEADPDGGSGGSHENESDRAAPGNESVLPLQFQTYKEAARKYYLQHTDNNMVGGRPLYEQRSPAGTLITDMCLRVAPFSN